MDCESNKDFMDWQYVNRLPIWYQICNPYDYILWIRSCLKIINKKPKLDIKTMLIVKIINKKKPILEIQKKFVKSPVYVVVFVPSPQQLA